MNRENIFPISLAVIAVAAVTYMVYDHYNPTATAQLNGTFTCIYATEGATCAYIPSKISQINEFKDAMQKYKRDHPVPAPVEPAPEPEAQRPNNGGIETSIPPEQLGTFDEIVFPPSKYCALNPDCYSI